MRKRPDASDGTAKHFACPERRIGWTPLSRPQRTHGQIVLASVKGDKAAGLEAPAEVKGHAAAGLPFLRRATTEDGSPN